MRIPTYCTIGLVLTALSLGCASKSAHKDMMAPADYGYGYEEGYDMAAEAGPMAMDEGPMDAAATMGGAAMPASPAMAPAGVMGTVPSGAAKAAISGEPAVAEPELPTTGPDVDQMLIFNGTVGLLVDHLGTATGIDEAVDLAVRAGGYIAQQTDTTVILRVPSGKFRKVMRGVEKLGDVQSRSVQTLDVSEEFHDLGVQLEHLEATRDRIKKLLSTAKDLQEIMTVERELERLGGEIDRIRGRMRFLSSQAAFSTLTVAFAERPKEIPVLVDEHEEREILPPPPPPPRLLDTSVDWIGEVDVHQLMNLHR
ncbi:MAG: DUF4349 domain-containing protein [Myxococcales bacterium]|nr:DUF4349 domain-containing protein [Myxococcales bacterium]MCB9714792.1 DUF4349 domain-containing protein [Myxococcales bacterium]